ncbi:MAG: hypothetical protein ACTMUB_09530 [cyanobacterium endosymbiont of Rhopalodia musculus]|nr:hypothetical protein [cyanobacterium endosymbiont of Epithemia clementina EcSB]WGT68286.1 hypothetical protein P3F56_04305 [cyanobacterium endosymbiont of Epithemia clementina EcSB]
MIPIRSAENRLKLPAFEKFVEHNLSKQSSLREVSLPTALELRG